MSDMIGLPFLAGDALAYTIATIKNCRRRFFPFLWQELSRQDLMAVSRSLAWLILIEERPATKSALWNATQRRLYAEATSWGWRRARRHDMRYDQRLITVATIERPGQPERPTPGALRAEVVAALLELLTIDELALLGGLGANLTEDEIAAALATEPAATRRQRRIIRRKLRQELERHHD